MAGRGRPTGDPSGFRPEIRRCKCRTLSVPGSPNVRAKRLTSLGGERFAEHVGVLSRVTFAAVGLLPTTRRPRGDAEL